MQFLATTLAVAASLGYATAAPWSMTSWTGQDCSSGLSGKWAVGPKTDSCITFNGVLSLNVTNAGPCKTLYYTDSACATSPFLANQGICDGFNGGIIGSFHVNCTS